MNELRRDADTIADSSDDAEHSCDDIRLAWLCAELAPRPRSARRPAPSRRCGPIAEHTGFFAARRPTQCVGRFFRLPTGA